MIGDEVRIGPFRLDLAKRELSRDGEPVRLGSRALDILCALASAKGGLVTKDALMAAVWPGQIIEENAIQVQVSALRKVLGEDRNGKDYIITVPGRGYRLIAFVPEPSPTVDQADAARGSTENRSIAVLPFQNISSDPEQEYFVDGMVEDIISRTCADHLALCHRPQFELHLQRQGDRYKAGRTDLGVRYVLEGSVRKTGSRVRVTVQLVDAEKGIHLWVEHYDRQA